MEATENLVAWALSNPDRVAHAPLRTWDKLVPQARSAGLLARIAAQLERRGVLQVVPDAPRTHLLAARVVADKHTRDIRWEVAHIRDALRHATDRLVLLKGTAYLMADLPPAQGRIFGDVDILVPRATLAAVESALLAAGWTFGDIEPYDAAYYRRHSHELPPLTHTDRGTNLDVHHAIVPVSARIRPSPDKLIESAVNIGDGLAVLAPADMVLHSAVHLFNEGEFHNALRDLSDIDALLRHFAETPGFVPVLVRRAVELGLTRPAWYALRHAQRLFDTPISVLELEQLGRAALPGAAGRAWTDALFEAVLRPPHADCESSWTRAAAVLLYLRAHHLRMRAHQLVPHLLRKAIMRSRRSEQPAIEV